MNMTALTASALTEQQRDLVKYLVVEGKPPEEAAQLAGYHPKSVYRTLRTPAVAAAIGEMIQLDLVSVGAPLAYRVAKALLIDEKGPLDRRERQRARSRGSFGQDIGPGRAPARTKLLKGH